MKIAETKTRRKIRPEPQTRPEALRARLLNAGIDPDGLDPALSRLINELYDETALVQEKVASLSRQLLRLEQLADEDALMPVANRRAFIRELSRLIALASRYGTESALVYIDLNGMKQINDRFGHNAGDAALQHVAKILIDHVRHADVVARLGGDEFGILLVRSNQEAAEQKAAALAEHLIAHPVIWNGNTINLSASFGAYAFRGNEKVEAVMEAADQAMYRMKQQARLLAKNVG